MDRARQPAAVKPPRARTRGRPTKRRGFALVVAVSLLALLVLVVVALATLTRVETAVAGLVENAAQARGHALAGLEVALGRLQVAAGPDRRATATAGVLAGSSRAAHPANTAWTGVWDSAATNGAPLAWLVSGAGPNDHTAAPPARGDGANDGVRLVGDGSADLAVAGAEVVVRRETITAAGGVPGVIGAAPIGRFAFWIGDEGVKGNLGVIDRVDGIPVPAAPAADDPVQTADDRARLRQLVAHRSGHDALNFAAAPSGLQLGAENDAASLERWAAFGAALDETQWRFQPLATTGATTSYRRFLRRDFHALTAHSLGLLVDSARGGLRTNWSDLAAAPVEVRECERYRPRADGRIDAFAGTSGPGPRAFQVKPVVTELAVDFVPYRDATAAGAVTGRLLVGVRVRVELWNPYNLPLAHTPAGVADYVLTFGGARATAPGNSGWPVVTVTAPAQANTNVGALDLRALLPPDRRVPLDCAGDLAPGDFVVVETVLGAALDPGLVLDDAQPGDAADDVVALDVGADASRVLAFEFTRAAATAGEPPLTRFAAFASRGAARVSTSGWSVAGNAPFAPGAVAVRDLGLSFHFRLDPARASWGEWIAPAGGAAAPEDFRANLVRGDRGAWTSVGGDPVEAARRTAEQFAPGELFAAGRPRRVADVTRQRNLSLAALRELARAEARPAEIGAPWGGAENGIFDAAFFAPVPAAWRAGDPLPHPRLRLVEAFSGSVGGTLAAADVGGAGAARHLAIVGAFNVNSVEPDAWTVALGRAVVGWRDSSGAATPLLENPWFNFPQTATEARAPFGGRRVLADAAVQALAAAIVARTQARGRPGGSLAEFVNSGLVQAAIDDAGWNTAPACTADVGGPPARHEADYVTQTTLLHALAPVLAARSDTFRIRVCGEALNPATGEVAARAYAEAIVQRVVEPVARGAAVDADATGYGRRFVTVGFRWLNEADL